MKLCDCTKYEENHVGQRKQKPTEFYMDKPIKKHMKAEASELEVRMENRFYSEGSCQKLDEHVSFLERQIGHFLGNGYNECARDTVCSERSA